MYFTVMMSPDEGILPRRPYASLCQACGGAGVNIQLTDVPSSFLTTMMSDPWGLTNLML